VRPCHAPVNLLLQSGCGRRAGYENVNDAERLRHYPDMRWIVGGKAPRRRGFVKPDGPRVFVK
jgi:hypothetical protein